MTVRPSSISLKFLKERGENNNSKTKPIRHYRVDRNSTNLSPRFDVVDVVLIVIVVVVLVVVVLIVDRWPARHRPVVRVEIIVDDASLPPRSENDSLHIVM